jgi:hypothetical protein
VDFARRAGLGGQGFGVAGFLKGEDLLEGRGALVFHCATVSAMSVALAKTGRVGIWGLRGVNDGPGAGRGDAAMGLRGFGVEVRALVDGESKMDLRALRGMPLPAVLDFAGVDSLERGTVGGTLAREDADWIVLLRGVVGFAIVVFDVARPRIFCCSWAFTSACHSARSIAFSAAILSFRACPLVLPAYGQQVMAGLVSAGAPGGCFGSISMLARSMPIDEVVELDVFETFSFDRTIRGFGCDVGSDRWSDSRSDFAIDGSSDEFSFPLHSTPTPSELLNERVRVFMSSCIAWKTSGSVPGRSGVFASGETDARATKSWKLTCFVFAVDVLSSVFTLDSDSGFGSNRDWYCNVCSLMRKGTNVQCSSAALGISTLSVASVSVRALSSSLFNLTMLSTFPSFSAALRNGVGGAETWSLPPRVTDAVLQECTFRPTISSPMLNDDTLAGLRLGVAIVLSAGRGELVELEAVVASLLPIGLSSFSTSILIACEVQGADIGPLSNQEAIFVDFVGDVFVLPVFLGVVTLRNGVPNCALTGVAFFGVPLIAVLIDLVGDALGLFLASDVATWRNGVPNGGLEGDCVVSAFFSTSFVSFIVVAFRASVPNKARAGVDFFGVPARAPFPSAFCTGEPSTGVLNSVLFGVPHPSILPSSFSSVPLNCAAGLSRPVCTFFGLTLLIGNSHEK